MLDILKLAVFIKANLFQYRVIAHFRVQTFAVFSLDASKPFIINISMFTISEASGRMATGAWLAVEQTLSSQSMLTRSSLVNFTYNTKGSRIVIIIPVSAGTDSVASFCHGVLVFFHFQYPFRCKICI